MTTPGNPTGPAESNESQENNQTVSPKLSVGEQVSETKKQAKQIESDPEIVKLIKKYHRKSASKDDLKKLFQEKLNTLPQAVKAKLDIGEGMAGVEAFMKKTNCFENQFLYNIEKDRTLKHIAKEELIEACVETADAEYKLSPEQKETLKKSLSDDKNENIDSLKIILDSPRLRKKRIKEYLKSDLYVKKLEDTIDFKDLHNKIINNLDPTDPNTKKIQAAWSNILGGIDIQAGESIHGALDRMRESVQNGKNSTDFDAFFHASDIVIPKGTKDLILNFMMRQYLPYVSLNQLEQVSPKGKNDWLEKQSAKIEQKTGQEIGAGTDSEWSSAVKEQREQEKKSFSQLSAIDIPTHLLDFETKVRLMSQFGNQKKIDQTDEYWKGHPGAIPSGPGYEKTFLEHYGFRPKHVATQAGLVKKLENHLGDRMKGIEHFAPGNIMTWKTKGPDGTEMIGYYGIDQILSDNPDDDSLVKVRFLGNNRKEIDDTGNPMQAKIALLGGMKMNYTGSRFFEYMASIVDEGEVNFIPEDKIQEQLSHDKVTTYTDEEVRAEFRNRYDGAAEVMSEDILNEELEALLQDDEGKKLEDSDPENRKIREKMSFAIMRDEGGLDTFEIEEIIPGENGEPPRIRLWDGWGEKNKNKDGKDDSRGEYTFSEFLGLIKTLKASRRVYRVPGRAGERFGVDQFNKLIKSAAHVGDDKEKKFSSISIEPDPKNKGKMSLGKTDKFGTFHGHNIVQVGPKKDLCIDAIDGDTVVVRIGTFTNLKKTDKGGIKSQASFRGSGPKNMPLSWLWSYMQSNDIKDLTSPPPEGKAYQEKEKGGTDMSWWNIFKHAHSMGTILHGDLWKAPWKAFEEQHHKDHAFAGKITAALAMEKAQRIPGVGSMFFDYDWANIMVGDANSSFQSYLDELVKKIDDMGSYHRTRMIKKWSKLHFPDPKFMAAMFASMKIFGQLYPYDGIDGEKSKEDWFWYNSIVHSHAVNLPEGWPHHMPPHGDEKWPEKNGQKLSEVDACWGLIGGFQHPLLKNLGRRYQKYMVAGHDGLLDGGKSNMEERTSMESKRDWMEDAILDGKPTEALGTATELWLHEGYPTADSTRPYGLLMMGSIDQQILPKTQEHCRDLFQKGTHLPMLVFMQNKNLGDVFRETMITFAYTMSESVGDELSAIIHQAQEKRVLGKGKYAKDWRKRATKFWDDHGKELMHKMTGMRDPMLNLLINAPDTFDAMMEKLPSSHKKRYERLRKGSDGRAKVLAYHKRLVETYDSATHVHMDRGKAFYSGDHFRFRDGFDIGYPMAWVNWDAYWDSNFDDKYGNGTGATSGDGIFNEIRGFLYKIPKMAKEMTKQMGLTGAEQAKFIDQISKDIFEKNIDPMKRLATQKINAKNPDAEYVSMTAMMFEIIPVQELTVGGSHSQAQEGYVIYKQQMLATVRKAKEIEAGSPPDAGFAKAIVYREKMAKQWSKIVKAQIKTEGKTLEEVESIGSGDTRKKSPTVDVIAEKHRKAMEVLQKKGDTSKKNPRPDKTDYRERVADELGKEEEDIDLPE